MLDEDLLIPAAPWNEGQYYFGHLVELRDAGVLTESEFAAAKARLGSEI
jgi:Short C-terminal domain